MVNNLPSSSIDVVKYKKSLIDFLRTYPQFTDYDFEGTNWDNLISILGYNAYNMAHYDSMVGNESTPDTAILRQSQVSHATSLNYLPRSRTSAQVTLRAEVYPTDQPASIVLPRYYRFKTTDPNGQTIYFTTNQDYVAVRDANNRYIFDNITAYQGDVVEEYFLVSGVTQNNGITFYDEPFVIASQNIDIDSLEVFVGINPSDPNPTAYRYAETLAETTNTSATYFLRGIYDNQYAIEFGDGIFGAPIANGNRVIARFRNTQGAIIQGQYVLSKTTDIGGYSNITITALTRVQGGFERESVDQLRTNSARHFQVQDRAVTDTDYESIISRAFPNIQQVSAFGGELIQQYGKVIIVLKPFGTTGVVSNSIKTQIVNLLKTKNIVPEPVIVDPSYYYIGITANVSYSGDIVKVTENQLRANIVTKLVDLNNGAIGDFDVTIFQSLLNDAIKSADSSITGSDVNMTLIRRWNPAVNLNETLTFNSNNPFKVSQDGAYVTPDDYAITTNNFNVFYNGNITNVIIQDDGIGNLYLFAVESSGAKTRIGTSIGTVDYENGAIKVTVNVLEYGNSIDFYCTLRNRSIDIVRDSFAIITGTDITVNLKRI